MYQRKLLKAGSIFFLLAFLFLVACNNQPEQTVTPPAQNQNATEDTSSTVAVPQQSEHTHTIEISQMKFNPDELTIHAGDTVIWINKGITNHCVTEVNKAWTSSTLVPGQSWKRVINKNTDYYCAIHIVMKGKIVLQ